MERTTRISQGRAFNCGWWGERVCTIQVFEQSKCLGTIIKKRRRKVAVGTEEFEKTQNRRSSSSMVKEDRELSSKFKVKVTFVAW